MSRKVPETYQKRSHDGATVVHYTSYEPSHLHSSTPLNVLSHWPMQSSLEVMGVVHGPEVEDGYLCRAYKVLALLQPARSDYSLHWAPPGDDLSSFYCWQQDLSRCAITLLVAISSCCCDNRAGVLLVAISSCCCDNRAGVLLVAAAVTIEQVISNFDIVSIFLFFWKNCNFPGEQFYTNHCIIGWSSEAVL